MNSTPITPGEFYVPKHAENAKGGCGPSGYYGFASHLCILRIELGTLSALRSKGIGKIFFRQDFV